MSKKNKDTPNGKVAVVRIRGSVHLRDSIGKTLKLLNLHKKNHCVVLDPPPQNMGMVQKVKDYITWGEVDAKTLEKIVTNTARIAGGSQLTDEYVKTNSSYSDMKSFTTKLGAGEANMKSVNGLKPVFRLKPPTKGFERAGIKKPYSVGGALGYRGEKINELLTRMI